MEGWRDEVFPYKRATKRNPQAARQERATVPASLHLIRRRLSLGCQSNFHELGTLVLQSLT